MRGEPLFLAATWYIVRLMPAKKQTPKSATPKPKSPTSPRPGDPKPKNNAAPRPIPPPARVNRPGQPRGGEVGSPTGRPAGPVVLPNLHDELFRHYNSPRRGHRPPSVSVPKRGDSTAVKKSAYKLTSSKPSPSRNPTKQDKPRGRTQSTSNKLEQSVARTSGQTRGNGGLVGGPNKNDAPKPKPGQTVPRPRSTPGYYL